MTLSLAYSFKRTTYDAHTGLRTVVSDSLFFMRTRTEAAVLQWIVLCILLSSLLMELFNFGRLLVSISKKFWYRGKAREFGEMWALKRKQRDDLGTLSGDGSPKNSDLDQSINESAVQLY
jgi:hypothetical protein